MFVFFDRSARRWAALMLICLATYAGAAASLAADWPMWRFDAGRSAASPENLPAELHLQWTRQYSARVQVWDDPLNHDLMSYDRVFEPVVAGDRMFVGFNDTDKVVALDTRNGEELWVFYTDGPVRFAPVAAKDKVYFTSDDGYLYCIGAADGKLKWKVRGGPSDRKVLGNERVISSWPARGGPVLRDGTVYFAASIWPFMGTFIYGIDAETGRTVWVNDGTGAQFIKQPHNAPAFAGVAPQGALVATDKILLVPGGRSVPAAYDRKTGDFLYFNHAEGGKGNGGAYAVANEKEFFVHTRLRGVRGFDLATGKASKFTNSEPVLDGALFYGASTNEDGAMLQALDANKKIRWELKLDVSGDMIKAGSRMYAAGSNTISAVELTDAAPTSVAWSQPVDGKIMRLLAANGRLFAVAQDGRIMAYGAEKTAPKTLATTVTPIATENSKSAKAKEILKLGEIDPAGYAIWYGADDGALVEAMLTQSQMHFVVVDPDAAKVEQLRRKWDAAGWYGSRVTLHAGDPLSYKAPPYIAHLVGIGETLVMKLRSTTMLTAMYNSVRPYGGVLWVPGVGESQLNYGALAEYAKLEKARLQTVGNELLILREGALPNSADWTHQYGDMANTLKSDDARVKAPLGILWFGGPPNTDVLPRHGHGPPEQVIGGRMFIQGMDCISARDVYTGRMLWKTTFPDLGTYGIYYNDTYTNTPLSTAYNQKHIPGANGRGANYVATEDMIYVVTGTACQLVDAMTGKIMRKITLPAKAGKTEPDEWGYIGITDDILIGGDGFAHYNQRYNAGAKTNTIEDFSASDGLIAFDRHTGETLWRISAQHSFLHNGIVAGNGRIYVLDKLPKSAEDKLKRRGMDAPKNYRIAAFDLKTGQPVWETQKNIFGTWLGYSKQHDVLLQAGAAASDRLKDEVGQGMSGYHGLNGLVLWQDLERKYTGPCIIHNELIFTSANSYTASSGAFNLTNGMPHLVLNPLTSKLEPWRISRAYGCNNIVASENLLTFRSGAAGFYDLLSKSGTGNLGGFKSGCTANLVVANGVLNAPDFTRTCSCAYQNQTSLAMVHMPEMEMWTYSQFGMDAEDGDRITHVGINFGAPGDRRAEDGTLWLEYPSVGGDSPGLTINLAGGQTNWFRRHASQVTNSALPWVVSSGIMDCETITIIPEILRQKVTKPASSKDDDEDEGRAGKSGKSAKKAEATLVASTAPVAPTGPKRNHPPIPYTVRLHFLEPEDLATGQRLFNVALQDKTVLENFDIVKEAAGTHRGLMKEIRGVMVGNELKISLNRAAGTKAGPLLCGVELIAETPAAGK